MAVLGIIPARGGSKRFPRKNLALLRGKPLLLYSIAACAGANRLDHFVVSSDDDEILALAESTHPGCALRRPAELASDTALVYDTVMHTLHTVEKSGAYFDLVAIVQCTSPLTRSEDIEGVIADLQAHPDATCAATIVQLDHYMHPVKLKTWQEGWITPWLDVQETLQPAQELETLYVRNGSVYVTRRSLLEQGRLAEVRCRGYLMPPERSIDINIPRDLIIANYLMGES